MKHGTLDSDIVTRWPAWWDMSIFWLHAQIMIIAQITGLGFQSRKKTGWIGQLDVSTMGSGIRNIHQWIGKSGEIHRKPSIFPLNNGCSCKFSRKPIHWNHPTTSNTSWNLWFTILVACWVPQDREQPTPLLPSKCSLQLWHHHRIVDMLHPDTFALLCSYATRVWLYHVILHSHGLHVPTRRFGRVHSVFTMPNTANNVCQWS